MARRFCKKKFPPKDAAEYLEIPQTRLDYWRWTHRGPVYVKLGGEVYYFKRDLDLFLESCRRTPARAVQR